ncbi:MAG: hypothetical protein E7422_01230 [Ruminococcaceae bacterium]|nr:hypothetical protein [Oscillospiraceae bacterium]
MQEKKIVEQKCHNCGAAMRFDPKKGKLICDHCGTAININSNELDTPTELEGFDFNALNDQATVADAADLPVYNCESCGAEVIAPPEQAALTCPYCANNIVLTDKVSGKLRPDGVVPFRIEPKELPAAMQRFYKDKVLLPRRFFSENTMGKVTGVYVPFWVFGGRLSGELSYRATRVSTHREGDYEVTETKHYRLARDVEMSFEGLPVDASARLEDELMDSLEPFDLAETKPFDMRYLAGFTADRFDQAKSDIASRAESRMRATAEAVAESEASRGYSSAVRSGGSLRADITAKYLLLPVYLFDIAHDGKKYHFAVNGQSGKVVGTLPIDKGVSRTYFLVRMLGCAAAVAAIAVAKYFMGR